MHSAELVSSRHKVDSRSLLKEHVKNSLLAIFAKLFYESCLSQGVNTVLNVNKTFVKGFVVLCSVFVNDRATCAACFTWYSPLYGSVKVVCPLFVYLNI